MKSRLVAKHAFVSAVLEAPDNDPTDFVNDADDAFTVQSFLGALKDFNYEIPQSCCTFAFSSTFTMNNEYPTEELVFSEFAHLKSLEEVDSKCKNELKRLCLDKLHIYILYKFIIELRMQESTKYS